MSTQAGVHRDCFGCGRTCEACKAKYIRTCNFCRAEYCIVDNEGSSETEVRSYKGSSFEVAIDFVSSVIGVIREGGGRGNCSDFDLVGDGGSDGLDLFEKEVLCSSAEQVIVYHRRSSKSLEAQLHVHHDTFINLGQTKQ
jgi:hypothetical protein